MSLSDPFYYEGDAYFIDRADPKQAFVVEAIPNPQRGLIAAVQAKFAHLFPFYCCSTIDVY